MCRDRDAKVLLMEWVPLFYSYKPSNIYVWWTWPRSIREWNLLKICSVNFISALIHMSNWKSPRNCLARLPCIYKVIKVYCVSITSYIPFVIYPIHYPAWLNIWDKSLISLRTRLGESFPCLKCFSDILSLYIIMIMIITFMHATDVNPFYFSCTIIHNRISFCLF